MSDSEMFNMNELLKQQAVKPSKFDSRDYTIKSYDVKTDPTTWSSYTCTPQAGVKNQGSFSTCVGYALSSCKEYQEYLDQGFPVSLSSGFIYANRSPEDTDGEGMITRCALSQLVKYGTCPYEDFPYNGTYKGLYERFLKYNENGELYEKAAPFRIGSYFRILSLNDLKKALVNFGPCIITTKTYKSWPGYFSDGVFTKPKVGEKSTGSNAMLVVGWKDDDILIIQNSWSSFWGDGGFGYMPWSYPWTDIWGVADISVPYTPPKRNIFQKIWFWLKTVVRRIFRV